MLFFWSILRRLSPPFFLDSYRVGSALTIGRTHMTHSHVRLIHMHNTTHASLRYGKKGIIINSLWRDSFICVMWRIHTTWLMHLYAMTHSLSGTRLIHMYEVTHSYVWCDSYICSRRSSRPQRLLGAWSRVWRILVTSHVYKRFTCPIWMSHVTRMNESCHTCEVRGAEFDGYWWLVTCINDSRDIYEWVMSHESCHTYERVMSHMWTSHVTLYGVWFRGW